jgi:hypothetical protein
MGPHNGDAAAARGVWTASVRQFPGCGEGPKAENQAPARKFVVQAASGAVWEQKVENRARKQFAQQGL